MKKLLIVMLSLSLVLFFGVGNVQAEYDVELTIIGGAVGEEYETTVKAAEMYMEENPGVYVEVLDSPDSADEKNISPSLRLKAPRLMFTRSMSSGPVNLRIISWISMNTGPKSTLTCILSILSRTTPILTAS